jgi:hypothetical protein
VNPWRETDGEAAPETNEGVEASDSTSPTEGSRALSASGEPPDTGSQRAGAPHTSSGPDAHVKRTIDTGPAADGSTRPTTDASSEADDAVERTSDTGPAADGSTRPPTDVGSETAASPDPALDAESPADDDSEPSTADRVGFDVEAETDAATERDSGLDSPAGADDRADRAVAGRTDTVAGRDDGSGESTADTGPTDDAGEVDVVETYTTLRRRLERELDIDGRWTTRQFYHACQMRGLDDDRLAALERLTRAYERVQDGDDPAAGPEELRAAAAVFGLDST